MQDIETLVNIGAWVGRQQAFSLVRGCCTLAQARCLKEVRETKAYEQLDLSWEEFCTRHAGISRVFADRLIRQLDTNGEAYFRLSEVARVGPETFRQIAGQVTADAIEIDGRKVALIPENAVEIRAAIRKLQSQRPKRDDSARNTALWQARMDKLLGELGRAAQEDPAMVSGMVNQAMASLARLARFLQQEEPAA